jgi:hypothetical protein
MPEGVGYGPQFTASTGLTLNVIGKHAYGYSGRVDFSNTETSLLEFYSPSNILVAKLFPTYSATDGAITSQDAFFRVYLNDVLITTITVSANESLIIHDYDFIIPPLSLVKVTGKNTSGGTTISFFATLIGRLYGKID